MPGSTADATRTHVIKQHGWRSTISLICKLTVIPRLHDQAGSTSWLYVSWTSQLDVCSMLAGCLPDVCSIA